MRVLVVEDRQELAETVATGSTGGRATLVDANSGPVVPGDQVEGLLQPFRRLGDSRGHGNGVGLGLSIVAAVVDAHHGELRLQPRAQGGLEVHVALPTGVL